VAGADRFERGEIVGVELGGAGFDDGRGARDRRGRSRPWSGRSPERGLCRRFRARP
jgi:hypothetical protein